MNNPRHIQKYGSKESVFSAGLRILAAAQGHIAYPSRSAGPQPNQTTQKHSEKKKKKITFLKSIYFTFFMEVGRGAVQKSFSRVAQRNLFKTLHFTCILILKLKWNVV